MLAIGDNVRFTLKYKRKLCEQYRQNLKSPDTDLLINHANCVGVVFTVCSDVAREKDYLVYVRWPDHPYLTGFWSSTLLKA
jgi:hypothetical protein